MLEAFVYPTWGMLPYATAKSWSKGDFLGEGITNYEGQSDIRTRPLTTADVVELDTAVHNAPSSARAGNIVLARPIGGRPYEEALPPVSIRGPLFECQHQVTVEDLIPGAQFEITAGGAPVFGPHYCTHSNVSKALLGRGLKEGESITAKQSFEALKSGPSRPIPVGPLRREHVSAPFLFEPIREGESSVFLRALEGAKLEIEIVGDGFQEKLTPEASDEINLGFNVRAGQKVRVRQQFAQGLGPQCEVWSDWREADVQPSPRSVPPPEISSPLYPCANSVAIKSKMEGALVTVKALTPPNKPIPLGDGKEAAIDVFPPLAPNQRVGRGDRE